MEGGHMEEPPKIEIENETPLEKAERLKLMTWEEKQTEMEKNRAKLREGRFKLMPKEATARNERQKRLEQNQERAA